MKVIKNKFFLICVCIALVICTLSSTFSIMGFSEPVRNVLGTVATPFRWCATVIGDAAEGFFKHFSLQGLLIDRNEELEDENERLKAENLHAQLLKEENERLRSYLGMKQKYPTFLFEEGMIIGAESSGYATVLTLNRGSVHGISVNMPVMVESGIVGYVTEVGLNWCKVSTILETGVSVGAYVAGTDVMGVIKGDYALSKEGLCKMTYLTDENAEIQEGDVILSSGVASVYPSDLVIGTVVSVTADEYSRSKVVIIRPTVDFSNLTYMLIITGYESVNEGGYQKPTVTPPENNENDVTDPEQNGGGYG